MSISFVIGIMLLTIDKIHVDTQIRIRVGPVREITKSVVPPYGCQTRLRVQAFSLASTQVFVEFDVV